jgi:hypothetical protein
MRTSRRAQCFDIRMLDGLPVEVSTSIHATAAGGMPA